MRSRFRANVTVAIKARRKKVIVFPFEEPIVLRFVLAQAVHLLPAIDIACVESQSIFLAAPDEVGTGIKGIGVCVAAGDQPSHNDVSRPFFRRGIDFLDAPKRNVLRCDRCVGADEDLSITLSRYDLLMDDGSIGQHNVDRLIAGKGADVLPIDADLARHRRIDRQLSPS